MSLKYYFSGAVSIQMLEMLSKMPDFEPIDVLISQLDRGAIKKTFEFQDQGYVNSIFVDSGAFSFHTGKAKLDLEEYIEYLNSIDDRLTVYAQVDTIPGKFGQPKSHEDYVESAQKSWDNYLYMRTKLKSPKKLTPVFHYGEDFHNLRRMLEWRDENGEPIDYIGISPANDTPQKTKDLYMKNVYEIIAKSSNPNVKTHLYGMTSINGLSKVPAYSADSISHRHIAAYNKILVPKYGVISLTDKARSSKSKSGLSFIHTASPEDLKEVEDYITSLGTTFDELKESSYARCAVTMYSILQEIKNKSYKLDNIVKVHKLFTI